MRAAAAARHFFGVMGVVFLVDGNSDAFAVEFFQHRHEGVRGFRIRRMVVVGTGGFGFADVGDIDHAHTAVPAAGP